MTRISIDLPHRELKEALASLPGSDRSMAATRFLSLMTLMQGWARDGKSILTELLPDDRNPRAYQHHPDGNAFDANTGFRWFYHCHPRSRRSVVGEHGHFHLFADVRRSIRTTHLMALSVDSRGLPIGLFLPNLWVTEDQSQEWPEVCSLIPGFMTRVPSVSAAAQEWLEHAVHTFRIALPCLWTHRQKRIDALQADRRKNVTQNRRIEVLSRCALDLNAWASELQG